MSGSASPILTPANTTNLEIFGLEVHLGEGQTLTKEQEVGHRRITIIGETTERLLSSTRGGCHRWRIQHLMEDNYAAEYHLQQLLLENQLYNKGISKYKTKIACKRITQIMRNIYP